MVVDMPEQITFSESQTLGSVGSASDGTYEVVLLTPGLGASAYYSESVVAKYAPTAWPKGTHVYLTHQRGDGGEPDPDRLLGSLVEDTTIRESDGAAVNRFKPLRRHADFVEDVHKLVGLSVNATGSATTGTVEGRTVKIAESIDYQVSNTVDMVSYPGRPGSGFVESIFAEHVDVHPEPSAAGGKKEERMAVEEEVSKLTESVTALVSLVESRLPEVAPKDEKPNTDIASAVAAARLVESADISDALKTKLIEGINEGHYDVQSAIDEHVALRESLREEIKQEFKESGIVGATGNGGAGEPVSVKGWAV